MANSNSGMSGCGVIGVVMAMFLSWTKWNSVGWTIIHGLFGWFYVAYYAIRYGFGGE